MQTIIQEEISRFGRNIFKEGSAVDAGTLEIDNNYKFVVLENGSAEVDELTIGSELSTAAGVKAIVLENPIEVVANSTWRVYIRYTDSGATTPGTTEVQFSALDSLNSGEYTVTATSAVGAGVKLYVDGVLNVQSTAASTGTRNTPTVIPTIGSTSNNSWYFEGNIDEVSIFDTDQSSNITTLSTAPTVDLTSLNPIAWYRFEEGSGTTAIDSGTGGNNGTLENSPTYSTDIPT